MSKLDLSKIDKFDLIEDKWGFVKYAILVAIERKLKLKENDMNPWFDSELNELKKQRDILSFFQPPII